LADGADLSRRTGLDLEQVQHLVETYGRRCTDLLEIAGQGPELRERLCKQNPDIRAQLVYAVKHEEAMTLRDFLLRRTGIGTRQCLGKNCCEQIAVWMAEMWSWDHHRIDQEIREYLDEVALGQRFRIQ